MPPEKNENLPLARMEILRLRAAQSANGAGEPAANFSAQTAGDALAIERPVAIEVNGQLAAMVMALPGGEEELAAGFALSEGIIRSPKDLLLLRACEPEPPQHEGGTPSEVPLLVRIVIPVSMQPSRREPVIARYACGTIGGGLSLPGGEPLPMGLRVRAESLREMLRGFSAAQALFQATGCTHAAGLFEAGGKLLILREDIGRHNAIDRVLGRALLEEMELRDKVLITTGRASAELAFKALSARVPVLASLSAPTALAVDWARKGGLTLIGFLRPRRFNIYAWPERILN